MSLSGACGRSKPPVTLYDRNACLLSRERNMSLQPTRGLRCRNSSIGGYKLNVI